MAPRGRGGKFSKPTRGGGKHFSRDLQPVDKDGVAVGMWRDPKDKAAASSDEDEDEESSEEESSDEEDGPSVAATTAPEDLTREQRRQLAKKKKAAAIAKKNKKVAAVGDMPSSDEEEEDDDDSSDDDEEPPANPNHSSKSRAQAQAVTGKSGETPLPSRGQKENLSRREREAIAAQQAKERYEKLHAEGKTDQAKADLARLRLIREQREAATARKHAEKEERDEREKENKDRLDRENKLRDAALGDASKKKGSKTKK